MNSYLVLKPGQAPLLLWQTLSCKVDKLFDLVKDYNGVIHCEEVRKKPTILSEVMQSNRGLTSWTRDPLHTLGIYLVCIISLVSSTLAYSSCVASDGS